MSTGSAMAADSDLGALLFARRAGSHAFWRRDVTPGGPRYHLRSHVLLAVIATFIVFLGGLFAGLGFGFSLTVALLFFIAWGQVAAAESWEFCERGVRVRRWVRKSRVTPSGDRSRVAFFMERGAAIQIDDLEFTSTRNADRVELEKLAVHYSRPVAGRMLEKVRGGAAAHWLPGLTLKPDGLFLTRGTKDSRMTVPYAEISSERVEDGVLTLEWTGEEPGSHRVDAGLPNVFAGRLALETLRAAVRT